MVAAVLALLDPLDRALRGVGVQLDARPVRAREDGPLPRELGDQDVPAVAHQLRVEVLERPGVGLDAGDVHPALVGERIAAHVRLVGVRGHVQELVDEVRRLGQEPQALGAHDLVAQLQLEGREDRGQVRVAAALADAVHRALDHARARLDGGERVRDAALGVVVRVDPHLDLVLKLAHRRLGGRGDLGRQARAVGVAQGDVLGPGGGRGAQALERVARVVAPGVEEVFGVVDDPLPLRPAEVDRVDDHRQVLLARDLGHLLQVKAPRLADERADRRERGDQHAQGVVLLGRDPAAAGHAERADGRVLEIDAGEQAEELLLLGVGAREARLDVVDAEAVERLDDAHLLGRRQGHPLSLHAVAKGGVVELNGGHVMLPFSASEIRTRGARVV